MQLASAIRVFDTGFGVSTQARSSHKALPTAMRTGVMLVLGVGIALSDRRRHSPTALVRARI